MSDDVAPLNFGAFLTYRFHLLTRLTERSMEAELIKACGLRLLECRIVGIIGSNGPMNMTGLCGYAHFDASQASRLVERLAKRGLVETRVGAQDRRAAVVHLTADGCTVYPRIYEVAAAFNERWMAVLSESQRTDLSEVLTLLRRQAQHLAGTAPAEPEPLGPRSLASAAALAAVEIDGDAAVAFYDALGEALRAGGRLASARRRPQSAPKAAS